MVGYNRIPTPVVSEPTLGFLAALAKRRRGSQSSLGAISPSSPRPALPAAFPPPFLTARVYRRRRRRSTPLFPSRAHPSSDAALSSCRCRLCVLPSLVPPLTTPRPTQYASHLVISPLSSQLRFVILFPLAATLLPPCVSPLAPGPRKRGIASNSNYRTNTRLPRVKSDTWSSYARGRSRHKNELS